MMRSTTVAASDINGADRNGTAPLVEVRDLAISIYTEDGPKFATRGASLTVHEGRTLGVAGESGSGKSMTAAAIMGLLPENAEIVSGGVFWHGSELTPTDKNELRGRKITLINQEPMSTLDPLKSVGSQLTDILTKHKGMNKKAARSRAAELFELVGINNVGRRLDQYAWQFSGGMAQRVVIAMAIAPEPELIIADEPTTAVDVTIQAQILSELQRIQSELGVAIILITHDLAVVGGFADDVAIMYAGRTVEAGPTRDVFKRPLHPYTSALLASTPDVRRTRANRLQPIPGAPPTDISGDSCPFKPRCVRATEKCEVNPALDNVTSSVAIEGMAREVACWHA